MKPKTPLDWLLEEDQPAVRYLALTQLLGRPEEDAEVRAAKAAIARTGWAADILATQEPVGWWVSEESLYRPKYLSTNWMLLILSDLGLTRENPRTGKACDLWIRRFAKEDGGFAMEGSKKSHLCTVGNTARARKVRLRGSSEGAERLRMARGKPGQERRLELLRKRPEPGLLGKDERLRRVSETEGEP